MNMHVKKSVGIVVEAAEPGSYKKEQPNECEDCVVIVIEDKS